MDRSAHSVRDNKQLLQRTYTIMEKLAARVMIADSFNLVSRRLRGSAPNIQEEGTGWVMGSVLGCGCEGLSRWSFFGLPLHNLRKKKERGGKKTRNTVSYPKYYFMLCGFIGCETPSPPPPHPYVRSFSVILVPFGTMLYHIGAFWCHMLKSFRSISSAFYF
jgi:hypothetical protein